MVEKTHKPWTPREILDTALSKEKEAYEFYSEVLMHSKIDFLQDLLGKLKNEEYKHIRMIEDMIANLNLGRDPV